ncbi:disulfide bond formation protein B [Agrobacterium sp. rho-8.1]|nr:disulfide bond formation protein B [Agrobacterium sp. rho-8.1]
MNTSAADPSFRLLFAAWIVALAATGGALFVGEVMGQAPCDLCWYQRSFMFPLVAVLGVGVYRSELVASLYALPLAMSGWLVAAFHNLLYFEIIPAAIKPCSQGPSCSGDGMTIFGTLPLPTLSLAMFTAIVALLFVAYRRHHR